MGKKVMITGATGMVGGLVLKLCLESSDISEVISMSRKPSGLQHEKLNEVIHSDFTNYDGLENHFQQVDVAYFCIGVYTGAVSRNQFRTITIDYTKAFSTMLKKQSPKATFCFLSGSGADQSEKSRMMFAKDKGIAENYLMALAFKNLFIFRPAYIYPVTRRKEPNLSYRLSRKLYPVLKVLMPNSVITSEALAEAIFTIGLKHNTKQILENVDIKASLTNT